MIISNKKIIETINKNAYKNISIADIASINYISESYVKLLFHRYAGTSQKQYYTNLRIYEASKLLKEGLCVKDVAERMKFSSPNYFSTFFREHTGITPIKYKKESEK